MDVFEWYDNLRKPAWTPPAFIFGPIWFSIYCLIAISFGYIIYQFLNGQISSSVVAPFILNLIIHIVFVLVLFTFRNNVINLINISFVLITLMWALFVIYPIYLWVVLINIPFLVWSVVVVILHIGVVYLNRKSVLEADLKKHA